MPDEPVGLEDALVEDVSFEVEATPEAEDDFEVVIEGQAEPELPRVPFDENLIKKQEEEDDKDLIQKPKIKERIDRLKFHVSERERQLAEEQKVVDALTQYGNGAKVALENLAKQNAELQKSLREQAIRTREAELLAAQNDFRFARESADTDKEVAASQRMAELAQQKAMLAQYQIPEPWQPPPPPMRQQAEQQIDPITAKWVSDNPWFEQDARMRKFAVDYSVELANQGVAPQTETYYSYINAEMRKRFPERFETGAMPDSSKTPLSARSTSRPPVATATRTNGAVNGKRTIVMSAEKARVYKQAAARFGVDFNDFVKNIPKEDLT